MKTKQALEDRLNYFEKSKDAWIEVTQEMLKADSGNLFPLDLFILGIVKRSILLTNGFCGLMREKNFLSAAPLVRLHLDNLLNMHAAFIVSDPHDFATKKMQGKQTNEIKDKNGVKMTDSHLARSLSEQEESKWVSSVYKETSKFVHSSDKHIFSVVQEIEGRNFQFVISDEQNISEEKSLEAINVMISITEQLFRHIYGWIQAKDKKS